MENCLFTALKGDSNNDNLLKVGDFRFYVETSENNIAPFYITGDTIGSGEPLSAYIEGDGYFYKGTIDSQTDITTSIENFTTLTSAQGWRVKPGFKGYITISNKYSVTGINLMPQGVTGYEKIEIDLNYLFKYGIGLRSIDLCDNVSNLAIDLDEIKVASGFVTLKFFSPNLRGNFSKVAEKITNFYSGNNVNLGVTGLTQSMYGNFEEFTRAIVLNRTSFKNGTVLVYSSSGDYTLNNKKTSGNILLEVDDNCDVTIKKNVDSSIIATYTKSTDTFVYYGEYQ